MMMNLSKIEHNIETERLIMWTFIIAEIGINHNLNKTNLSIIKDKIIFGVVLGGCLRNLGYMMKIPNIVE